MKFQIKLDIVCEVCYKPLTYTSLFCEMNSKRQEVMSMDGGPSHMCRNKASFILLPGIKRRGDRSLLASLMPLLA